MPEETTTEPEYMVSYQYHAPNVCGNFTGTLAQVNGYAEDSKHLWKSYSFFLCLPPQGIFPVRELKECNAQGELL